MHMAFARRFFCVVVFVAAALFLFSAASSNAAYAAVWDGSVASSFDGGTGTQADPYRIANGAQLARLGAVQTASTYFELTADIDLGNLNWTPIDSFYGNLDGAGFTISNLNINEIDKVHIGFFRVISGYVRNLNLKGAVIGVGFNTGMLAGLNTGNIAHCTTSGSVSAKHPHKALTEGAAGEPVGAENDASVGGLVGHNPSYPSTPERGLIDSCFSDCAVSSIADDTIDGYGDYDSFNLGGMFGLGGNARNSATNTMAYGSATTSGIEYHVGGLIGFGNHPEAKMTNNAVYGANTATGGISIIGGLIGHESNDYELPSYRDRIISNNLVAGQIKISNTALSVSGGVVGIYDLTDLATPGIFSTISTILKEQGRFTQ